MKILVSSAGRFHSVALAHFLQEKKLLGQFFYAGLPQDATLFDHKNLSFFDIASFADRAYCKFSGDRILSQSKWYVLRDGIFDYWVGKKTNFFKEANLFVGWANASLNSLILAQQYNIKTILESGSMHVQEQEKILKNEYEKRGLKFQPICSTNKNRMLKEYELTDFIMVPSEHVKQSFLNHGFNEKKVLKNPYGINTTKFFPLKKSKSKTFSFLFVGQVSLQKGIFYLLNAWKKAGLPKDKAELMIVGPINKDCVKFVENFKNITNIKFLGPQPYRDIPKIMQSCDVFVLPSLQEGLAMVIGEAMASGLCPLATKESGGYELFDNEKEGFIIESTNIDALVEKIKLCFSNQDLCKNMGELAHKKAQKLSWDNYGQRAIKIYEKIINDCDTQSIPKISI